jgi:hypothetical protein
VTLESFVEELHTSASAGDEDRICLALPVLGEATMRLGAKSPIKPEVFLEQFRAEPDKVSLSAAVALGRAGSGNPELYLPVILETMQKGGNTQYFLIQSIKEVLSSNSARIADLQKYSEAIWQQLLIAADTADNRVICAECVGRLVIIDPQGFVPKLQVSLLQKSSSGKHDVVLMLRADASQGRLLGRSRNGSAGCSLHLARKRRDFRCRLEDCARRHATSDAPGLRHGDQASGNDNLELSCSQQA